MADASLPMVILRLVVAVTVVIGLLVFSARLARRAQRGVSDDGFALDVISRRSLGRNASVAVVRAGTRVLVVGFTDGAVTLLSDQADTPDTARRSGQVRDQKLGDEKRRVAPPGGVLPETPRTTLVEALRERTVRRG